MDMARNLRGFLEASRDVAASTFFILSLEKNLFNTRGLYLISEIDASDYYQVLIALGGGHILLLSLKRIKAAFICKLQRR